MDRIENFFYYYLTATGWNEADLSDNLDAAIRTSSVLTPSDWNEATIERLPESFRVMFAQTSSDVWLQKARHFFSEQGLVKKETDTALQLDRSSFIRNFLNEILEAYASNYDETASLITPYYYSVIFNDWWEKDATPEDKANPRWQHQYILLHSAESIRNILAPEVKEDLKQFEAWGKQDQELYVTAFQPTDQLASIGVAASPKQAQELAQKTGLPIQALRELIDNKLPFDSPRKGFREKTSLFFFYQSQSGTEMKHYRFHHLQRYLQALFEVGKIPEMETLLNQVKPEIIAQRDFKNEVDRSTYLNDWRYFLEGVKNRESQGLPPLRFYESFESGQKEIRPLAELLFLPMRANPRAMLDTLLSLPTDTLGLESIQQFSSPRQQEMIKNWLLSPLLNQDLTTQLTLPESFPTELKILIDPFAFTDELIVEIREKVKEMGTGKEWLQRYWPQLAAHYENREFIVISHLDGHVMRSFADVYGQTMLLDLNNKGDLFGEVKLDFELGTITHEYTHLFTPQLIRACEALPALVFYVEGIAIYTENKYLAENSKLPVGLHSNKRDHVNSSFFRPTTEDEVEEEQKDYSLGARAILKLERDLGEKTVLALFSEIEALPPALPQTTAKSIEQLFLKHTGQNIAYWLKEEAKSSVQFYDNMAIGLQVELATPAGTENGASFTFTRGAIDPESPLSPRFTGNFFFGNNPQFTDHPPLDSGMYRGTFGVTLPPLYPFEWKVEGARFFTMGLEGGVFYSSSQEAGPSLKAELEVASYGIDIGIAFRLGVGAAAVYDIPFTGASNGFALPFLVNVSGHR